MPLTLAIHTMTLRIVRVTFNFEEDRMLKVLVASVIALAVVGADAPPDKSKSKPLFDGKTLKGWRVIGQGEWKVEDGAIVGRNVPTRDFGHLVSDKSYKDFTLRVVYKAIK